jgi:Flp pilus assembly protein TadD
VKIPAPLAALSNTRIAIAAGLACLYAVALPVKPLPSVAGVSTAGCLTAADGTGDRRAVGELEECSVLVPADAELLADLAEAYEDAGRLQDAESTYRRALSIDPDFADVRRSLARLLERRGATDEARRELEAANHVQPNRHDRDTAKQAHP